MIGVAYSLVLDSDLPGPLHEALPGAKPELTIRRASWSEPSGPEASQCDADGNDWLLVRKGESGYQLDFSDAGSFFVSADARTIRYRTSDDLVQLRHQLFDHVVPRSLQLRSLLPLHATAVSVGEGVLGFVGATGTGKSTLAAALTLAGAKLWCDDCLTLSQESTVFLAHVGVRGARLCDDARQALFPAAPAQPALVGKQLVELVDALPTKQRLGVLCVVERGGPEQEVELAPLSGAAAALACTQNLFRIDTRDPDLLKRELSTVAQLVTQVPVLRLSLPDDLSRLGSLVHDLLPRLRAQVRA